jgi:hypothetical protein
LRFTFFTDAFFCARAPVAKAEFTGEESDQASAAEARAIITARGNLTRHGDGKVCALDG